MKHFYSTSYLLFLLLSLTACADSPKSPVSGPGDKLQQNLPPEEEEFLALKFKGRDGMGRKCDLFLALREQEESSEDHDHALMVKVDYLTLDGHSPHAGEVDFYLYDPETGKYYDQSTSTPDTQLVLFTMSLEDPNKIPDIEKLTQYIKKVELEQYIRIELTAGTNAQDFKQALKEVLGGSIPLNGSQEELNVVEGLTMATLHHDHYHFPSCSNYKPVGLEETKFEVEAHPHDSER